MNAEKLAEMLKQIPPSSKRDIPYSPEWENVPTMSLSECEEWCKRESREAKRLADEAEARARSAEELADKIEDLAKRATHLVSYLENKYSRKKA